MSEKMTLTTYLEKKGLKAKALKRGEAEAFGIPYPLQTGWPKRYGAMEITAAMIEDATARMGRRKDGSGSASAEAAATTSPAFHGFVLRQARRYRTRKPAPWA